MNARTPRSPQQRVDDRLQSAEKWAADARKLSQAGANHEMVAASITFALDDLKWALDWLRTISPKKPGDA